MGGLLLAFLFAQSQEPFAGERQRMVRDQIERRGIRNARLLRAMREVPRHWFVPHSLWSEAYDDHPLAIGLGQTISQPFIVARMTDLLDLDRRHKVLEIGTGSGYQAAILSELVEHVYTIEIVAPLARDAEILLRKLGYKNVTVRLGDGYQGWPEKAPFDRILLTAAPPEIPRALTDQLAPGGKLLGPVGPDPNSQYLLMIDKGADGKLTRRALDPVRFVPMVRGR